MSDSSLLPAADAARSIAKTQTWLEALNPYHPDQLMLRDGLEPIEVVESDLKKRAAQAFAVVFAIFLAWAFFAPLDAGVHVSGSVVVLGNRKAIQHPTGGVVREIRVREGSQVTQGDTLITINPLTVEAELNSAELDYLNALTEESRLIAERAQKPAIAWMDEIHALAATEKVEEAKLAQTRIFQSRRDDLAGRQGIINEQIAGFGAQIGELSNILQERKHQLKLVAGDAESNAQLAAEGFVPRSRANEVERQRSDLVASLSNTTADIGRARSSIANARLQMAQERAVQLKEIDGQMKEVQKTRKSLKSRVESLRFNMSLTDIKAPTSGTVLGLKVFTVGGVITGGHVLMEIIPKGERLVVSAKIPPHLIDKVRAGLECDLRFTAFNQTTTPVIQGKVSLIGADKLTKSAGDDPLDPPEFYVIQVVTTDNADRRLGDKLVLPGMPVDVVIKTGERTFASYLIKPIVDRLAISFKED